MSGKKAEAHIHLIDLLRTGDDHAYAALYDAYSPMLFGLILRIVNDRKEAENLLQDCFIKIWRNLDSYDESKGRLATWLNNIARNTAIDFTRSKYFHQKQMIRITYIMKTNIRSHNFLSTPWVYGS